MSRNEGTGSAASPNFHQIIPAASAARRRKSSGYLIIPSKCFPFVSTEQGHFHAMQQKTFRFLSGMRGHLSARQQKSFRFLSSWHQFPSQIITCYQSGVFQVRHAFRPIKTGLER
jgi:hypothetical protein